MTYTQYEECDGRRYSGTLSEEFRDELYYIQPKQGFIVVRSRKQQSVKKVLVDNGLYECWIGEKYFPAIINRTEIS